MNSIAIVLLAAGLGFGSQIVYGQTSHQVAVRNNSFTPKELTVTAGDTVVWKNTQGVHNVNGSKTDFPGNPVSFGNALGSNWTYSFVFTTAGVYNYHCDPHIAFGMVGKVTVLPKSLNAKLTVDFVGMTPHVGQMFTFYVRDKATGLFVDTVLIEEIPEASFRIQSSAMVIGKSYYLDFYADHNGNGLYNAPPVDHAWRMVLDGVTGDASLNFTHNTSFTDIFEGSSGIVTESTLPELQVYPNPVTSQVNIALNGFGSNGLTVSLYQATGALIVSNQYAAGMEIISIEMGDYTPGFYLLTVRSGNDSRTWRMVKK
jgi:plastocyanin